jgi:hypothetical protein
MTAHASQAVKQAGPKEKDSRMLQPESSDERGPGCSADGRLAAQRSTAASDSSMANGPRVKGEVQHSRHGACNRASKAAT